MVSIFAMSGLLACGTALCPPPAIAANNSLSVNVSVNQSQSGIDWTKGDASNITAVGVGLPKGQGMALARVAAIMVPSATSWALSRACKLMQTPSCKTW